MLGDGEAAHPGPEDAESQPPVADDSCNAGPVAFDLTAQVCKTEVCLSDPASYDLLDSPDALGRGLGGGGPDSFDLSEQDAWLTECTATDELLERFHQALESESLTYNDLPTDERELTGVLEELGFSRALERAQIRKAINIHRGGDSHPPDSPTASASCPPEEPEKKANPPAGASDDGVDGALAEGTGGLAKGENVERFGDAIFLEAMEREIAEGSAVLPDSASAGTSTSTPPAAAVTTTGSSASVDLEDLHGGVGRRRVAEALRTLGFSEAQAREAMKRCSSVEAAVEWLASHPVIAPV